MNTASHFFAVQLNFTRKEEPLMQKPKLTLKQFAEIKTMIKSRCCNCYQGNCLLLDDGDSHTCPQLITPSRIICRYFLDCVLPSDNTLMKSVTGQTPAETIVCALCGSKTEKTGRNQKFCPDCARKKQRQRNAEYMSAKRSRVDVYDALKPPK